MRRLKAVGAFLHLEVLHVTIIPIFMSLISKITFSIKLCNVTRMNITPLRKDFGRSVKRKSSVRKVVQPFAPQTRQTNLTNSTEIRKLLSMILCRQGKGGRSGTPWSGTVYGTICCCISAVVYRLLLFLQRVSHQQYYITQRLSRHR